MTEPAVMENVADVAPAGTVTEAGTETIAELPLASVTAVPPAGAAADNVTRLPVRVVPAVIAVLASWTLASTGAGGLMVRAAVAVLPPYEAVIVAVTAALTLVVAMVNGAELAPAGMVTVAGTPACGSDDVRFTVAPCAPAVPVSVTAFDVVVAPPTADVGFNATEFRVAAIVFVAQPVVVPPPPFSS